MGNTNRDAAPNPSGKHNDGTPEPSTNGNGNPPDKRFGTNRVGARGRSGDYDYWARSERLILSQSAQIYIAASGAVFLRGTGNLGLALKITVLKGDALVEETIEIAYSELTSVRGYQYPIAAASIFLPPCTLVVDATWIAPDLADDGALSDRGEQQRIDWMVFDQDDIDIECSGSWKLRTTVQTGPNDAVFDIDGTSLAGAGDRAMARVEISDLDSYQRASPIAVAPNSATAKVHNLRTWSAEKFGVELSVGNELMGKAGDGRQEGSTLRVRLQKRP